MRWFAKGFGGARYAPEEIKREGWHEHGILVVSEHDQRLTWPERQFIRQLGERFFGKRKCVEAQDG
jgi:hypothetical protein